MKPYVIPQPTEPSTKDMTGHKSAVNISQLALANVDFDMQNRHHLAYNLMLVHNSTQSVGNYEGKMIPSAMITVIKG